MNILFLVLIKLLITLWAIFCFSWSVWFILLMVFPVIKFDVNIDVIIVIDSAYAIIFRISNLDEIANENHQRLFFIWKTLVLIQMKTVYKYYVPKHKWIKSFAQPFRPIRSSNTFKSINFLRFVKFLKRNSSNQNYVFELSELISLIKFMGPLYNYFI